MAWFRCASQESANLPSWLSYTDVTIDADTETFDIPYDTTKTCRAILCYLIDGNARGYLETSMYSITSLTGNAVRIGTTFNSSGDSDISSGYGSATPDSTTGLITFTARGGSYKWYAGRTYRCIILYEETT